MADRNQFAPDLARRDVAGVRPRTVVVADREARERFVDAEALELLASAGTVEPFDGRGFADAEAVVFAPWRAYGVDELSPECWREAPRLKVIAGTFGCRFEEFFSIELAELEERGVVVVDTSRSNSPTVAEFGLAMILNLLRDIPDDVALVRRGGWRDLWSWPSTAFVRGELTGRSVGIAGFGAIGRRLAELLRPFDCSISVYDPFVRDAPGQVASLRELAAGCEIFVVAIPRTPATIGVVDADVIDALPRGSLFVLLTRMAVVDQEALWARTSAGEIRAAVDVWDPEPPPVGSPARTDPNVLPTPHIAGNTAAVNRRCFMLACRETVAALRGEPAAYAMTARDADLYSGRLSLARR